MRILIDGQTLSTPEIHRGIGRVMVQLCEEMLPSDSSKEWYFTVQSKDDLKALGEEAQRHAIPLVSSVLSQDADPESKSKAYGEELSRLCSEHDIALYWNPNPLMLNVILPLGLIGVLKVCTIHDLIPLMMRDIYHETWPQDLRDEYDLRVAGLTEWADHLVCISHATREDYQSVNPNVEGRSSVISHGVDHSRFWAPVLADTPASPPYVLMVGGPDHRKNMHRAIVAFAWAVSESPQLKGFRFEIVGCGSDTYREGLVDIAEAHGVADRIVLHDFVEERALAQLYRRASLFFFPSLYEGFGLPVLEAMACGTPSVISDRRELLECAGETATVCDPTSHENMADALVKAITNEKQNLDLRTEVVARSRKFDWARSAAQYCDLFSRLAATSRIEFGSPRRFRVAWLSPWPPSRTGVADYAAGLAEALRERIDIDLFLENHDDLDADSGWTVFSIEELRNRHTDYDAVIYHLGNNSEHHAAIYRIAWEIPGIIVLHDFNIHPFLHHAYLGTSDEWLYRDALIEGHGSDGLEHFEAVRHGRCDPDIWTYPLSHAIASRSLSVIVHSAWVRNGLRGGSNVHAMPLQGNPRPPRSSDEISVLRESLGLKDDEFVIGLFGFLNSHKRIPVILEACARLRERGYPVHLILVGSNLDPNFSLENCIAQHSAQSFTTQTGYIEETRFWDYLDASDVVMNLRFPTMGESSASLVQAFSSGKPCLVTDLNQFAEIPDSVCWKAEIGPQEVDQIVAYLEELLSDPDLRQQLGESAREFVTNYASKERAALLYESVVAAVSSTARREEIPGAPRRPQRGKGSAEVNTVRS